MSKSEIKRIILVNPIPQNWITKLLWPILSVGVKAENRTPNMNGLKGKSASLVIIDEVTTNDRK